MSWIDDDIDALDFGEVLARIQALHCGCRSYDDPGLCLRITDPAEYALGIEIGAPRRCDCDCHDIWEAWLDREINT